jgi:hypothetical protein
MAVQRSPSDITPEAGGLEPINFHRLVKPVREYFQDYVLS